MRSLGAALLLVLLATGPPATAVDLLTYRAPDGTIGITDNEKLVPPGAEILRREPATERREGREWPSGAQAVPSQTPPASIPQADPEAAQALRWRQKLREAHEHEERAARALEIAERDYRTCRHRESFAAAYATHPVGETMCDDAPLQAAQHEYERAKAYAEDGIEDECRRAGCLPGWLR